MLFQEHEARTSRAKKTLLAIGWCAKNGASSSLDKCKAILADKAQEGARRSALLGADRGSFADNLAHHPTRFHDPDRPQRLMSHTDASTGHKKIFNVP